LRQYGASRLIEAGETATVRDRHLAWALRWCDPVRRVSTGDLTLLANIGQEVDNIRSALEWAMLRSDGDAACWLGTELMGYESFAGDARRSGGDR
jgi:hypothetical protein